MVSRLPALVVAVMLCGCAAPASPSETSRTTPSAEVTSRPAGTATGLAASPTTAPTGLTWSSLDREGPPAREDHTWTVDGEGRLAYLFGGRDGATVFGDLWAYDLERDEWSEVDAAPGPPARFGHEAVWVDEVGLVVFAGQAGSTFFADLWAFDPLAGWEQLPAEGDAPVARYGTCAAVGPDGRLWISHGFTADGSRFADTRAYDFGTGAWADETPAEGARPVERCLHGCWWTDAGELALYAGQTTGVTALGDRWRLTSDGWVQAGGGLPPERNLYADARLDEATIVFGGQALDGSYLADLWLLDDAAADAEPLAADGEAPAGRAGAELIRDPDRQRLVLFGGRGVDGAFGDLWELRGNVVDGT